MTKIIYLLLIILSSKINAQTSSLALWELGFLGGIATVPHYPASNDTNTVRLYFPSFIYRGLIFRSDDKGTRASFFRTKRLDIDLSFGASFPASAKENKAREGMDDLDWLGEVGPRVSYMFYKSNFSELEAELPLRYVFSTDFGFTKFRGFRLQPQVDYRIRFSKHFLLNLGYKLNYGTEELTDYFYEVTPRDTTSERNEFNAKPGFIGHDYSTSIIFRYKRFFAIAGVRRSHYHDAANEDSPLFKTRVNTSQFLAFNYFFYQSKAKASKNDYIRTPTQ